MIAGDFRNGCPPAGRSATVTYVETLPPFAPLALQGGGAIIKWRDALDTDATPLLSFEDGTPALVQSGQISYLAGWPDAAAFARLLAHYLDTDALPDGLRCRDTAQHRFWFNYADHEVTHGHITLPPAGVLWEKRA